MQKKLHWSFFGQICRVKKRILLFAILGELISITTAT